MFEKYGKVTKIDVTNMGCTAFVQYSNSDEALFALHKVNTDWPSFKVNIFVPKDKKNMIEV